MVDEIGSPGLQIYVHPHGDTESQVKSIEEVGNRICALHASAINPEVDYGKVFQALRAVGYDWYWCFEVGGDLIAESAKKWREIAAQHRVTTS
jgi:sugar phosphate isomerase/epimerase